jgi:orotate phosphoribosyltransferase
MDPSLNRSRSLLRVSLTSGGSLDGSPSTRGRGRRHGAGPSLRLRMRTEGASGQDVLVPEDPRLRNSGRALLARQVGELCRLSGQFTLRSGQISSTYFDKYLFEADPNLLREIAGYAATMVPDGTEVLAGLELGGVPLATALSLATGIPAAFVRKEAKSYGTAKLAEGADVTDRRVLVVEDVITTGGQVAISTRDLRDRGALVDSVLCVIDRSGGDHAKLDSAEISVIALFASEDLG